THPRTLQRLKQVKEAVKLVEINETSGTARPGFIYVLPPLSYLEFLRLLSRSKAVLTDSGGIQEETTFLGIPCLTLRNNTERPSTVELGTNQIVGLDRETILSRLRRIEDDFRPGSIPALWDGRAAERISDVLCTSYETLCTPLD